jgi:hypothetical protein
VKPKTPVLVNAAQIQIEHPDTFQRPEPEELAAVCPGNVVKVGDGGERFWVVVKTRVGKIFTGTVNNMLLFSRLKFGSPIKFHTDNIFDISP